MHRLLKANKTNNDFVKKITDKEKTEKNKQNITIEAVKKLLKFQYNLWRTSQIVEELKRSHNLDVKSTYVANILRNVFSMRYKRVKRVAI